MSVVAVKNYADKIEICADSIMTLGHSKRTDGNYYKLSEVNEMIIGSVGYAEEGSLMFHYAATHKPLDCSENAILGFICEFSKWKRDLTGNSSVNNLYIIIYKEKIFEIENMFVIEITNYTAIGAGRDYANAALYLNHSPKEAVKVACELCCFVSEPIIYYEVKKQLAKTPKDKK